LDNPIESYVLELKGKLLRRFDDDSVEKVVEEVRCHLAESAQELQSQGCPEDMAKELAVARFGSVDRSPLVPDLSVRLSAGDRVWGRIALLIAVASAIGLVVHCLSAPADSQLVGEPAAIVLTAIGMLYLFALRKARAFSLTRLSVASVAAIIASAALVQPQIQSGGSSAKIGLDGIGRQGLLAQAGPKPALISLSPLQGSGQWFAVTDRGRLQRQYDRYMRMMAEENRHAECFGRQIPPTSGLHDSAHSPDLTSEVGIVPDSVRLAFVWFLLMAAIQACVGWLQRSFREPEPGDAWLVA
jgi:hypothetical protein